MSAIIDNLRTFGAALLAVAVLSGSLCPAFAQGQTQRPNIVFIMGDDIGWANIGVYNQGHHGRAYAELGSTGIARHAVH